MCSSVLLYSCSIKTHFYSSKSKTSQRFCFGTLCSVTVYGKFRHSDRVFDEVWKRMNELENTISCKIPDSVVSRLNNGDFNGNNDDVNFLISTGDDFEKLTDGAFSPYIGKVSELWGIGTDSPRVPTSEEIMEALKERKLDFGALGKGYASDVARDILVKNGVESAVINFGGNICCVGSRPDGKDFLIGLQDPDSERGKYKDTVNVSNLCVVTSGDYERFFISDGTRYCHIMDGRTGYPVSNGTRAVTVIGESGLICDALSTCCFILGEEDSSSLLAHFPTYKVKFFK